MAQNSATGLLGRARAASVSLANTSPQLGMWQATGTAIARAPNLTELQDPGSGGSNITFDAHGHSARIAQPGNDGSLVLVRSAFRKIGESPVQEGQTPVSSKHPRRDRRVAHIRSLHEKHKSDVQENWGPTLIHGLNAFWKFCLTPSGFCITIYFLNIVVSFATSLWEGCDTGLWLTGISYPRLGEPCSSSCS